MSARTLVIPSILFVLLTVAPIYAVPVDIEGSSWTLEGTIKTKIQRGGKETEPTHAEIYFGPQDVTTPGGKFTPLAPDEALVDVETQEGTLDFFGTYTSNRKGKPRIRVDIQRAEAEYRKVLPSNPDIRKIGALPSLDELYVIAPIFAQSVYLMDLDGDGDTDVLTADDFNAYWYERGPTTKDWTQHTIKTGLAGVEGIIGANFDGTGDNEVVILDQEGGKLVICQPASAGIYTGSWNCADLKGSIHAPQDMLIHDIDGDSLPELLYTWEGYGSSDGGVAVLDWQSGSVLNPDNWTNTVLTTQPGAWWLNSSGLVDLNGDGRPDLPFTAREHRNPSAEPGVFYLQQPVTWTSVPWPKVTIDSTHTDWLHIDTGDFNGDGIADDVIAQDLPQARGPAWYENNGSWTYHAVTSPDPAFEAYNIRTLPFGELSNRDSFLYVTSENGGPGAFYICEFLDADYTCRSLWDASTTGGHPDDDKVIFADLDGSGTANYVFSGGEESDRLYWAKINTPAIDLKKLVIKAKPRNKNGRETIDVKAKAKLSLMEGKTTTQIIQRLVATGERFFP
jgi:hypothetical protein